MRESLRKNNHGERVRREDHLLKRAVSKVVREETRQREERRKQRSHPDNPRGHAAKEFRLSTDTQRYERNHHQKEEHCLQDVRLLPVGKQQIPADHHAEKLKHGSPPDSCGPCGGPEKSQRHQARGTPEC